MAKKTILLIVLILTMMQPAAALAGDKIIFTSIPDGLDLVVGESIDFSVTLENTGVYADVCIQFRNIPDGITVVGNNEYKLMDMDRSATYDLTLSADESVESGIYVFEIGDTSNYDFRTWTKINLAILNVGDSPVFNIIEEDVGEELENAISAINGTDADAKTDLIVQDEEDSAIDQESSDSIMDTTVTLTYSELLALVIVCISITIINLIVVVVVGIVRKRKLEKNTAVIKDENATSNDIVYENDHHDAQNGGYNNEDDTE